MDIHNLSIEKIINSNYNCASILLSEKINLCNNKDKKLSQIIAKKKANEILDKINNLEKDSFQYDKTIYGEWETEKIINHIIFNHHKYVRQVISELIPLFSYKCVIHNKSDIKLEEIENCFKNISQELEKHMNKEESRLFPYIHLLESCMQSIISPVKSIEYELIECEHSSTDEMMQELKYLTNNYTIDKDACLVSIAIFGILKEFEDNLNKHIHLEDNILFKRAKEIEKKKNNEST